MEQLFLFDDIINRILAGTINDWLADRNKKKQLNTLDESRKYELYLICLERHISDFNPEMSDNAIYNPCYPYLLLYNEHCSANVRQNILNELEYTYQSLHTYEIYHLIKNRFYEAIAAKLEKELLILGDSFIGSDSMYYMSSLMCIAAKNKDICCLKLFLEKGFRIREQHLKYLAAKCGDYVNEQIVPLLKEYVKGREK